MRITYPYPHNLSACALSDLSPRLEARFVPARLLGRSIPGIATAQGSRHAQAHGGAEHAVGLERPLDDFFDNAFNRASYDGTSEAVARDDCIHESACGTGAISTAIASVCAHLGLGAPG